MADYQATSIAGTSYIRAKELVVRNELDGIKGIGFIEEQVFNIGDQVIKQQYGGFFSEFTPENAGTVFPLLDINGEPTAETATFMDVYLMLMSLYYAMATARDNQ